MPETYTNLLFYFLQTNQNQIQRPEILGEKMNRNLFILQHSVSALFWMLEILQGQSKISAFNVALLLNIVNN